ncbi:hypothetical protein [Pelagicoccus mobilis]|uniref:Uncharacterized protein n=1 Tax=Pelagicoccus mobilis TaxID=415221 RepID=A0A934VPZ4_9BACT|nr:hypothetical protein [Pelagicoccus mobilis]MBK1876038.1 hypothetical protein [Pelagicoccus mobilis]
MNLIDKLVDGLLMRGSGRREVDKLNKRLKVFSGLHVALTSLVLAGVVLVGILVWKAA